MHPLRTLLLITLLALGACSPIRPSKFQCPHPEGVSCMSTLEVYQYTESADEVVGPSAEKKSVAHAADASRTAWAASSAPRVAAVRPTVVEEDGALGLFDAAPAPMAASAPRASTEPPLLTPARVLRIWLAPWEDTRGDLHLAGYVFSEVQGRRWRVGQTPPASRPVLRLLEAEAPVPAPNEAP